MSEDTGQRAPEPPALAGSPITPDDLYLLHEGRHFRIWEMLGSHPLEGAAGVHFAVWAPHAAEVHVVGEFNGWKPRAHPMTRRSDSGVWEAVVPEAVAGQIYKYRIISIHGGEVLDKADPCGLATEVPPKTASRIWRPRYDWGDEAWMGERGRRNALDQPMSIYEIHLGSWRRGDDGEQLGYREIAPLLADYLERTGFTHVELMPVMEHPYYASWGYQVTGFFAPSARQGSPEDLMYLIDVLHQRGIGVILDWVPSHFPKDAHGLFRFDGSHLYEHADPRQGHHPDWNSAIFNYGCNEVVAFLVSSAMYWLECFHADGLRVDAVASMLYRDYSRAEGEWVPNRFGGHENLEAISFLRTLNTEVYGRFPDVQTFAEESTAWPLVSHPVDTGGLGFGLKWDMGWMHDMLRYMAREPLHRRFHHEEMSFRMLYANSENYVLPLSHDEVVHGKSSLVHKMPGDEWRRLANLRLLLGYQTAQPGKKLLFMGAELGQRGEWSHEGSVAWGQEQEPLYAGAQKWVSDLNRLYREQAALHRYDCDPRGFGWVEVGDAVRSVYAFLRRGEKDDPLVLVVGNFTATPRAGYRLGVPVGGAWHELLNGDLECYGGSGMTNGGAVEADDEPSHGYRWSLELTLPPLALLFLGPGER